MADPAAVPDWLAGERFRPTTEAMLGAIGGLVTLAGLSALFPEIPDDDSRLYGMALSLCPLVVGAVLTLFREQVALRVAGVALAAGAVFPLAVMVVEQPERYDKADMLVAGLLASLLWAALFVGSPARGHGLFLGLALAALWTAALSQTTAIPLFSFFEAEPGVTRLEADFVTPIEPPAITVRPPPTFVIPTPPGREIAPPTVTFPTPTFYFPTPSTTTTTAQSLGTPELIVSQEREHEGERPPVAPAVVSMVFGVAYLAAAVVLDGARLRRLASPFVVVGALALLGAVIGLGPRYGAGATGAVAGFVGLAFVAVGLAGERRPVAWFGALVTAVGIGVVVDEQFESPGAGAAVALLLVGAVIVAGGSLVRVSRPAPPGSG